MRGNDSAARCMDCGGPVCDVPGTKRCWPCNVVWRIHPIAERFWSHVTKGPGPDDCWLWGGLTNKRGYGIFGIGRGKSNQLAHRFAYELVTGEKLGKRCLLHSCDVRYPPGDLTNRRCVRPDHTHPGTRAENNREMREKGRAVCVIGKAVGADHPQAKVTPEMAAALIAEYRPYRVSKPKLAEKHGISLSTVSAILAGRHWTSVTPQG